MENLLGLGLSDNTGTSGTRDKSDSHGAALTGDLAGHGVGVTDLVTPVTFSDGGDVELGVSDGTLDSSLDFLVAFLSESDMSGTVTDQDNSFEAGSLTGSGHLLHGLELHNFLLKLILKEIVDNLAFFNWDGELEDFFKGLDLAVFDKTAELGDGLPLIELVLGSSALVFSAFSTESSFLCHIF